MKLKQEGERIMSTTTTDSKKNPTPERLMQFAWGYSVPLMIEAGVTLGVFDALEHGAKTAEQLREQTGTSQRGLTMLLNALCSVDLLRKEQNRYALAPESEAFLVSSKPDFRGGLFKHISKQLMAKWMHLNDAIKSGKPVSTVNQQKEGAAFFEQFVEDIFPMSYGAAGALGDALKLPAARETVNVLDIAAGSGVWGVGLAEKSNHVHVTAVDWPEVIPVTRRVARKHGVVDRFNFIEGDINSVNFGSNYHIATLGHIVHSEGQTRSRKLFQRVYDALRPGGTIVISEFTPNDDRTGPANTLIFALNMLVNTDEGDTYTFNEIRSWLTAVGFKDVRQLEAPAPSPLILANKPS
jgi:ubiquinone/menaquinone biosynthesis C-methylase UbiE